MTTKKVFKVTLEEKPINKSRESGLFWEIHADPVCYVTASDITSALYKATVNIEELIQSVGVRPGYKITGIHAIADYGINVYA